MREIDVQLIQDTIEKLFTEANYRLPESVTAAVHHAAECEEAECARNVMKTLCDNIEISEKQHLPVCQDTGMAVLFAEIGQDVHITGGLFNDAVNAGVHAAYENGYLRKSVVKDPFFERVNTNDNTPAVIYTELVAGDKITLTALPKGFGSENMSRMKMFTPSASREDIVSFVLDCVKKAGSNPCPPILVGVGIGGTFDKCAQLSKKALMRDLGTKHADARYAELEEELLSRINETDIGPQGFGGKTTALGVHIETYPTHIAGLPVAVNINCHIIRHKTAVI